MLKQAAASAGVEGMLALAVSDYTESMNISLPPQTPICLSFKSCHIMSDFHNKLTDSNEASELPLKAGWKGRGVSVSPQYKRSRMIKTKRFALRLPETLEVT